MPRYLSLADTTSEGIGVVSIERGGTSGITAAEALMNLNGISATSINQPNGVLGLNSDGYIETNIITTVTIDGPLTVMRNTTNTYTITNFDSFTDYNISATVGLVSSLDPDKATFTYTSPTLPAQGTGFYVNDRFIAIEVTA